MTRTQLLQRLVLAAALAAPMASALAQVSDLPPPPLTVPEPDTLLLVGLAVVGAVVARRKRK